MPHDCHQMDQTVAPRGQEEKKNLRYQKGNLTNKRVGYHLVSEMIADTSKENQFGCSSQQAGFRMSTPG